MTDAATGEWGDSKRMDPPLDRDRPARQSHRVRGQMMTRRFSRLFKLLGIGTAALMLIGAWSPEIGAIAPDFQMTLVDGTRVSSADLRGKVVVINFWATWCGPCREELPMLDAYYQAQQKAGLRIFTVTIDKSVPSPELEKLLATMNITAVGKIHGPYGIMGQVPTNYIIDRSGHLRYAEAGAFDLDTLNENIIPLLKEPARPDAPGAPTT
jgi:cytochrome c biogenesis protein CcmG/thiol:disulfide interchange protein DsbE